MTDAPTSDGRPATVVLVHGAWHGAWCWDAVVEGLSEVGIPTLAIDLPGHGADPGPALDLTGDAAAVRAALDGIDGPVVLCGHSYGGAVITEAGDHPAVAHLVYLAAFLLDVGESAAQAATAEAEAAQIDHSGRVDFGAAIRFADDGTATIDPAIATELFYGHCPPAVAEAAVDRLDPQRMANLMESVTRAPWRTVPTTYAVCTDDQAVHPDLQEILAARAGHVVRWDTDHSPFASCPADVVDLLTGLARNARP